MSEQALLLSNRPVIERMITAVIRDYDYSLMVANDVGSLYMQMEMGAYSIVFVDTNFIEKFSDRFFSSIRDHENTGDSFYVFLFQLDQDKSKVKHLSFDAYLPVPFSTEKFASLFRVILNQPKRILIVSQKEEELTGLYTTLVSTGYVVSVVKNGRECIQHIYNQYPDLIIADIELEDLNGLDLAQRIRSEVLIANISIILLTMHADASLIEECLEAGVQDVLLFPFYAKENIQKIVNVVKPPKKGKRSKALVIDDSIMIRNLISKMFKQLGYVVEGAENGLVALETAREFQPDVITCDYDMPVMNGWEFCVAAKKDSLIKQIPIIMVTARGTDVDRRKGYIIGVSDYLSKPFKIEELQKSVAKVMVQLKEQRERETMEKFMAGDVLSQIEDMSVGSALVNEQKFMTIFFSDIRSFTPKCEFLTPDELVFVLNEYFDLMISLLQKYHAVVDKLIGDAIVARFVNEKDPSCAANSAVCCALEMIETLKKFNYGKEGTHKEIEIRIGINSGNAILGSIGSQRYRLDYTMVGDSVNIAARLESSAPVMGCLISEYTYNLIKDKIEVGEVMSLSLKGKSEQVNAYIVKQVMEKCEN